MVIQNLRNALPIEVKKKTEPGWKNQSGISRERLIENNSSQAAPEQSAEDRGALLSSIRNKIKKGFYNSEAVLDDLSHGFASALDQTV